MEWGELKKVKTCFFKVELTIIVNGFLNIQLSFARSEWNADRCPSRKCAKYAFLFERLGSSFYINNNLHIDVLFFHSILNEQRIQLVQLDRQKKSIKMQWHIPTSSLHFVLHSNVDFYCKFDEYSKFEILKALLWTFIIIRLATNF